MRVSTVRPLDEFVQAVSLPNGDTVSRFTWVSP